MGKVRYYEHEKYEPVIGTFATASVFTFVGIISLIFMRLNVNFLSLRYWGYWMLIPAFFIYIGGFRQLYTNKKYKKALLATLMDRNMEGTHKLEEIAQEVGLKPKDALQIFMNLREKGLVKYRFNSKSGEIILGESTQYRPVEEYISARGAKSPSITSMEKKCCIYCGQPLKQGARFCEYCGSEV
ncbi:MAG: zinc-ribbon domain-containing protein [Promethearchaeota archaeon]